MSKFNGVKTDNAKITAKKEIRENVLSMIKERGSANIIEVFCGTGEMYQSVWKRADKYLGIDKLKFFDERTTICGDALKALLTIDISEFNIFDIDAYGSPYDCLSIITDKLIGRKGIIGFVITDGSGMDLKMGNISKGLQKIVGLDVNKVAKIYKFHDLLIKKIVENISIKLGADIIQTSIAKGKTGAAMRYYSYVLDCK